MGRRKSYEELSHLRLIALLVVMTTLSIVFGKAAYGEDWGNLSISYIREVENQLFLSDFQLGSEESIRDEEGHGIALGWLIARQETDFFLVSFGISQTAYRGAIEDGVNVSFDPKSGSGFEALSQSKNIIYEFDLSFSNPFISISYTNWFITEFGLRSNVLLPSTYGIGLIQQNTEGNIIIKGIDGTEIAEATYESGLQRFYSMGWNFNYEFLQMSIMLRHVTSPTLQIKNCNDEAVGDLACDRIIAATGNRNNAPKLFTGGVFSVGMLF